MRAMICCTMSSVEASPFAADPAFGKLPAGALKAELEPSRYTGRAREQVAEFLEEYATPLAQRARPLAVTPDTAEVRV